MDGMALVIGIGNPLREDDGAGWHVVQRLKQDASFTDASVLWLQQLTPELAETVSRYDWVAVVDASLGSDDAAWKCDILPDSLPEAQLMSHEWHPAQLAALARTLYGHAPRLALYSIFGKHFGYGNQLSCEVERAVDAVVAHVKQEASHARSRAGFGFDRGFAYR